MSTTPSAGSAPRADPPHDVPAPGRGPRRPVLLAVGGLVLLALVLRLPTAGVQSFWLDEVYTGRIVDGSLGHAWSTIQRTENTPPLFYLLDWGWGRIFGTSEFALRSLSAVVGALAVVPVVLLARLLGLGSAGAVDSASGVDPASGVGPASGADAGPGPAPSGRLGRAGAATADALRRPALAAGHAAPLGVLLAAGLLMAVNPLAQWFGQEARSYALFLLLSGAAWLALMAALQRPSPRALWLWAAIAVATTWTHYFGGLLLVVGWAALAFVTLRGAGGGRWPALRPLAVPAAVSAACVAALAPIAVNQQSTDMYQAISMVKGLPERIVELPKQFAVGYSAPVEYVLGAVVLLLLAGLVLAAAWPRDGRATRATGLLGLVVAIWVLPLIALIGGFDVVLTRNYVLLIPPLAVLAALGAWRIGRRAALVLGAVAVVQVATIVLVALTPVYQREDWRGVMEAVVDDQPAPEAIFMRGYQAPAATYYVPDLRQPPAGPLVVRSLAVADRIEDGEAFRPGPAPQPPPGFTLVRDDQQDQYRVFVWRAPVPTAVPPALVDALQTQPRRVLVVRR